MAMQHRWPGEAPGFYGTHRNQQPSSVTSQDDGIAILREQLLTGRPTSTNKKGPRVFLENDLDRVWSGSSKIGLAIGHEWSESDLEFIRSRMKKILSILIIMRSKDCLREFRTRLFNRSGPLLLDEDLPVQTEAQLAFLDPQARRLFMDLQSMFVIYEMEGSEASTSRRTSLRPSLPFDDDGTRTGSIDYDTATRVESSLQSSQANVSRTPRGSWRADFEQYLLPVETEYPSTSPNFFPDQQIGPAFDLHNESQPRRPSFPQDWMVGTSSSLARLSLSSTSQPPQTPRSFDMASYSETSSTRESRLSISQPRLPSTAHGINLGYDKLRPVCSSQCWPLKIESNGKRDPITDISLTLYKHGTFVIAALSKTAIHFFAFDQTGRDTYPYWPPIQLALEYEWKHVTIAGPFLAAWGSSKRGAKQVVLKHVDFPGKNFPTPKHERLSLLKHLALSSQGSVALVCDKSILCTHVEFSDYVEQLAPQGNRSFATAAFNEAGDILYAWSFGQGDDMLHLWRIQDGKVDFDTLITNHVTPYAKVGGEAGARIFPYNTQPGAVIEAPRGYYFPSTISKTNRRDSSRTIPHAVEAYMFQDHSLITLETENILSHPKLKEYDVRYGTHHSLAKTAETAPCLYRLKSKPKGSIKIMVTKSNDIILALVCSVKGELEVVEFASS